MGQRSQAGERVLEGGERGAFDGSGRGADIDIIGVPPDRACRACGVVGGGVRLLDDDATSSLAFGDVVSIPTEPSVMVKPRTALVGNTPAAVPSPV